MMRAGVPDESAEEEDFANLVAANESFGSAEIVEDVHDFAIGNGALEDHRRGGRDAFQSLGVENAIPPKPLRWFVVQVKKRGASGPHDFR